MSTLHKLRRAWHASDIVTDPEPRWPAVAAGLAVGVLYFTLNESLSLGPRWLLLSVICLMVVPLSVSRRRGHHHLNQALGYALNAVITGFLVASVYLLVHGLTVHSRSLTAGVVLHSAVALWLTNVFLFASWYWRLDAGGPHERDTRDAHTEGAFLFPQMSMPPDLLARTCRPDWSPQFVDYLFLAFNTSTALSPTDTAVLTRWAKVLMMVQSAISLVIIALLAARAVNIL